MKTLDQRRSIDAYKLNHTAKVIKKFVPQGSILEQLMNFATSIPDFFLKWKSRASGIIFFEILADLWN